MSHPTYVVSYLETQCSIITLETFEEAVELSNVLETSGITTTLHDSYDQCLENKTKYLKHKLEYYKLIVAEIEKELK
jgi:hypothetical protein